MFLNYFLIISSVFLNCCAQLLMRIGMLRIGTLSFKTILPNLYSMFTSLYLWLAILCFLGSIVFWFIVLSRLPLSFAYPWQSLGIVITSILGFFILRESLDFYKIAGILLIIIGIFIISNSKIG